MNAATAVLYLRISRDMTGEGKAHERQQEICEELAAARGIPITRIYADTESAYSRSKVRPGYNEMVRDFAAGQFTTLICYDLDRLTRQPAQLEWWIDTSETTSLTVLTASGDADLTTDNGRLFARIKAAVARAEMDRKSARQKVATVQRAKDGKPQAGVRLTGYRMNGDLVPEEAEWIARLFRSVADGQTITGAAKSLQAAGIRPINNDRPGIYREPGAWSPSTVRGMLLNPRYAGRAIHQGKVIDLKEDAKIRWEPIVDEALFDRVGIILRDPARKRNHTGTERKWLGSGLYECATCGRKMTTNGTQYVCRVTGHVAKNRILVDEAITGLIRARLSGSDLRTLTAPVDDLAMQRLARQARDLRDQLSVLRAEFVRGVIKDGALYQERADYLNEELTGVEIEMVKQSAGSAVSSLLLTEDPALAFDKSPVAVQHAIVNALCTVKLYKGERGKRGIDLSTVVVDWKQA